MTMTGFLSIMSVTAVLAEPGASCSNICHLFAPLESRSLASIKSNTPDQ